MNTLAAVQQECASFMKKVRPVEEAQDSANKRCDKLFWRDENGCDRPFVCALCDEVRMSDADTKLLDPEVLKKNKEPFMWSVHVSAEQRIRAIEEIYQFTTDDEDMTWTKGLALSLRGSLCRKPISKKGGRQGSQGFTCCAHCEVHANVVLHCHPQLCWRCTRMSTVFDSGGIDF
jgi:hypothetical protein